MREKLGLKLTEDQTIEQLLSLKAKPQPLTSLPYNWNILSIDNYLERIGLQMSDLFKQNAQEERANKILAQIFGCEDKKKSEDDEGSTTMNGSQELIQTTINSA